MVKGKRTYIPFKKSSAEKERPFYVLKPAPKSFISWVERPLIFSNLLKGDCHYLNKKRKKAERRIENIKGRSTQDINTLVARRI